MLTLLSPAKTLRFELSADGLRTTEPAFASDTALLVRRCKQLPVSSLRRLMRLSEPLAELNRQRFRDMTLQFTDDNSRPCVLAFAGDVYRGLDAPSLSRRDLNWAQNRLRILSGLYGMLRPLDRIQPYRLEMGTRLDTSRGKNLYEFWGMRLADALNDEAHKRRAAAVINLASQEYFKAVPAAVLQPPLITPLFQELRDGAPRTISFYAKRARGLMARFIIDQRITEPDGLRDFAEEGYRFRPELSDARRMLFLRPRNWAL